MTEVTRILNAVEHGDRHAAEQLLPLGMRPAIRVAAAWVGGNHAVGRPNRLF
jgi:hypothetical protein